MLVKLVVLGPTVVTGGEKFENHCLRTLRVILLAGDDKDLYQATV